MNELVEQLNTLFEALIINADVDTRSPLVRTALAINHHSPDIIASQMPLSSFNVFLSEYHGKCFIPVVGFPTMSKDTDTKNSITSAIEDFIVYESGVENNVATALRYVIDENIDNITEHADTPIGVISARWDGNGIMVCIADSGKTIYGSYLDGDFDQIYSDQVALQAAVSGISTKNLPGAENRGYGISTSADMIVKGMNSTLIILSGRGLLLRNGCRKDFTELPESVFLPGTLVCFTMPLKKNDFSLYNHIGG